jgi:hypothetical protein
VTIAIRPSLGETGEVMPLNLPDALSGIFLLKGLDRLLGDLPVGQRRYQF